MRKTLILIRTILAVVIFCMLAFVPGILKNETGMKSIYAYIITFVLTAIIYIFERMIEKRV